jgi:hypothetical protein
MPNLTPCPSCGQEVSLQAATCPTCGHPLRSALPLGKRNTIVLVWVVVVMILVSSAAVVYLNFLDARARADEIQAEFDATLKGLRSNR